MKQGRRGRGVLSCAGAIALALLVPSLAIAAPSNDDFSARQQLGSVLPVSLSTNNSQATVEAGEPKHPGFVPAGHSIWFEWEAPDTELITVGTCGSDPATILSVYTGTAIGSLTEVASNRYSLGPTPSCFSSSETTFKATAGTKYQIQIDGNGYHASGEPAPSGQGTIELQIQSQGPPANDDFANATQIPGNGTPLTIGAGNWGERWILDLVQMDCPAHERRLYSGLRRAGTEPDGRRGLYGFLGRLPQSGRRLRRRT